MPGSVALQFTEALHHLVVKVTSLDGITANDSISTFEAKGTVYLVKIIDVQVNSNPSLSYSTLTNDGQSHTEFRLNFDDSFTLSYEVYENGTPLVRADDQEFLIANQNPNYAADPTAINLTSSTSTGDGILNLSANTLTPSIGYELLIYVAGHKTSQQITLPTNITIFWDQLKYKYTYFDDLDGSGYGGDYGTDFQEKSLGLDVNESWNLYLEIFYASDNSPAYSSQISYRFSDEAVWTNLTDGAGIDLTDGKFLITRLSNSAQILSFSCRIANGSIIQPNGTTFVDQTFSTNIIALDVTWTFLIIDLIPTEADARLNIAGITSLSVYGYWAHDPTNQTFYTGDIEIYNSFTLQSRTVIIINGTGLLSNLFRPTVGVIRLTAVSISNNLYGVTKFSNTTIHNPESSIVEAEVIWDGIYFTFAYYYNNSLLPSDQDWDVNSFYTNYGENVSLYCFARHSYDDSPFTGAARLYDFNKGSYDIITFNTNGTAIWYGNRTDARRAVEFRFLVVEYDNNFNVTQIATSDSNQVFITWEKVIMTLYAYETYLHGSWADISVDFRYEISQEPVDPMNIRYDLLFSNESSIREDFSQVNFRAFSFGVMSLTLNITFIIDFSTGLTAKDIRYQHIGNEVKSGFLTITWVDNENPIILETQVYDTGNGLIQICIQVTDSGEYWLGSGIESVTLIDNRFSPAQIFPFSPKIESLNPTLTLYTFEYNYSQRIDSTAYPQWAGNEDYFIFMFGTDLSFQIEVYDYAGNFVEESLEYRANYDSIKPEFLKQGDSFINITYLSLNNSDNLVGVIDGSIIVTVMVHDWYWSGLSDNAAHLLITDLEDNSTSYIDMNLFSNMLSAKIFTCRVNLTVFKVYELTVLLQDIAGNENTKTVEIDVVDSVGPQIRDVNIKETESRQISITVELTETGLGVDYVTAEIVYSDGSVQRINLTATSGIGSFVSNSNELITFSGTISPKFDIGDFIGVKSYSINIITVDKSGNMEYYDSRSLINNFSLPSTLEISPLVFNPIILVSILLLLIGGIIVGIRLTSKVEGYDLKKIYVESNKISRDVILTQMDEYALGVTVNFFDQVQGPVPVIWEPPLLEDQEQVMLDLSDKSFSILEFVGIDEYERSGTFDFSTGSYDCTALGYTFAVDNPQARGGKENLTIILLLRKEWGDNLLVFQDELVEKLREIRKMIESQTEPKIIENKARDLREYVSRLMIALDRIYFEGRIEKESKEE